jgi:hypothetical protein
MGVESKLYHIADETPTVAGLRHDLCFQRGDGLDRRRRLVCPKPNATILARRFNPVGLLRPVDGCAASQCSRSRISGILACGDAVNLLRITAAAIDPASASACPNASLCDRI